MKLPLIAVSAALPLLAIAASGLPTGTIAPHDGSISVGTTRGTLVVTPFTDDIFRITVTPARDRAQRYLPSKSVILTPQNHKVNVTAEAGNVTLYSPTTSLTIDRATGLITFRDSLGREVLAETTGLDNTPDLKTITFAAPGKQQFFGAGEKGHRQNLSGDTLTLYNRQNYGYTGTDPRISQMGITMPYLVSDAGYAIFIDDHNKATLIAGDTIKYSSDNPAGLISYYFINGNGTLAGATENFTLLTGRQELPPFWSLGYITSKYGYHTADELTGAIDSLKTRGYPVDGAVLDLYWYGKETDMGRLQWNKEQWPDHKKMLADLQQRGVNTVIIHQPYINKIGAIDNYNLLDSLGMLTHDAQGRTRDVTTWVGDAGMFDVSNPDTRQWMWDRLKQLTDEGVAGWWGDLGEPEVHPEQILHHNGMTATQYHNAYGNDWSKIIYDGYKKDYPDRRMMSLMRGGTAGLQRFNVFPWSTDVSRSWGGLAPQVNIMLSSGLSGLGYMSSDIGGFAVDPAHPTDPELYVRWLQMGAFTPTLRTHAQLKPEPYHYPGQQDITLKYIKMRYEWLPYNYTLAYENATQGLPLARPIDFRTKGKASHSSITDEYLWGDNVLVAPVMKKGARSRRVTFPQGEWIDFENPSRRYRGGSSATVPAPLATLPLYVRAGSFIPLYTRPIENTTQYDPAYLTVRYYPTKEWSSYTLFDDDRLSTTTLEHGAYQLTTFTGSRQGNETYIDLKTAGTGYKGMPMVRHITFQIFDTARAPKSVTADGRTLAKGTAWSYDSSKRVLTVNLDYSYGPCRIVIR